MIAVIVGTRPEIIKMAPVMREMDVRDIDYIFLHTNQHYSKEMDADIIADLQLRAPDYNFEIGSLPQGAQTGRAIEAIESYFLEHGKPDFVLVHGDTNASLAGALASVKLHIPVGHVEAGLRSFDRRMPEECNRMIIDTICDAHFAPTKIAKDNLLKAGISIDTITVCGNTVVDALLQHMPLTVGRDLTTIAGIKNQPFIIATAHRPENVDEKAKLSELISLLDKAASKLGMIVVAPLHPRTVKNIKQFNISVPETIHIINPVSYINMLALLGAATLVLTDSGGLQEEAYILEKPLMTLRTSTERPETLNANFLIGTDVVKFIEGLKQFENNTVKWEKPFGTGDTSMKIIDEVSKYIQL